MHDTISQRVYNKYSYKIIGMTMTTKDLPILKFNTMTQSRYDSITPNEGEFYCVDDSNITTQLNTLNQTVTTDNININIIKQMFGLETKVWNNKTWLKLMYHDAENGTLYFDNNNVKLNFHPHLYSICQFMPCFDNNGFEFLLEYPELEVHNNWFQTSCPSLTTETVTGYQAIDVQSTANGWGGLSGSLNTAETWLDGNQASGNWWYAVGAFTAYQGGIPGALSQIVQKYALWVRID